MLYGGLVQVKRVSSPVLRIEDADDAQRVYDSFEKEFAEAFSPHVVNKPGGVYVDGIVLKATVITEKMALAQCKQPYVIGADYTIADIAAFPWLRNHVLLDIDIGKFPAVKAWVDKIAERDAVKRALAKVATIKSSRDKATDEDKDRFFGRGQYARA